MRAASVWSVLVLVCGGLALGEEPTGRDLSNPGWWFARAQAELKLVMDPEAQAILGSMISSAQGQLAPPGDLPRAIEARFSAVRDRFGADADWQFALFAARQYDSADRFREAIDALCRGRQAVDRIMDNAKRSEIRKEFDSVLDAAIGCAASKGEVVLALESVSGFHRSSYRDSALDHISYCSANVSLPAAEKSASRISVTTTPSEWRLLLLLTCRGGDAAQYERAIQRLLDDRAKMDAADVRRCYTALCNSARSLPADISPQMLSQLQEQLAHDMAPGAKAIERSAASKCLAALLIVRGRLQDAYQLKDENGKILLEVDFRTEAAEMLIERGDFKEATRLSPTHGAAALTRAGKLDEALNVIAQFKIRGAGYSGYACDVAKQFAGRDDWQGVERALSLIDDERSWGFCLAQIAEIGARAGRGDRVVAFLRNLTDRLVEGGQARREVEQRLAMAYLKIGDPTFVWRSVERDGPPIFRALLLIEIAQAHLRQKDAAGFDKAMSNLKAIVADESNLSDGQSSVEERGRMQAELAVRAAMLYLKAGDRRRAHEAIKAGFARAGNLAGSLWRIELYAELLSEDKAQYTPTEIADLMEIMPVPADRTILACLGGALAARPQGNPSP